MVRITKKEVEALSRETLAFLEYRSPRDQEIVHKMYRDRPTLGGDGPGSWGATFVSWRAHEGIYNATEDKDLWTDPSTARLYTPEFVLGNDPADTGQTIRQMAERGFWPVFEGKHVEQHLVGIKPVRWWLSVEAAERKYDKPPRPEATLAFRETASNTNERTCIAAVIPSFSVGAHTLSGIGLNGIAPDAAATIFNSLCFDFLLRLRTAGTHVSFTYMKPMPVPPSDLVNRLPCVLTHLTWLVGVDHITDIKDLWPLLWDANRAVAEAYGLAPEDFEHILNSFPVFARKRPAFLDYLKEHLAKWKEEAG